MKRIFISLLIFIVVILLILASVLICKKTTTHEETTTELKSTEGLTTALSLDDKITENAIWCGTFQLIWNDLKNELAKQEQMDLSRS